MNSDKLVKDAYESILRNLPSDDADKVRAYVADQEEIQRRVGQNRVERKNHLGLFAVLLAGGIGISAISILLWRIIQLPDPQCEVCEVCPPPPPPPKTVEWDDDPIKDWLWVQDKDAGRLCVYKQRTLTCWFEDPVPPTIPASPFDATQGE